MEGAAVPSQSGSSKANINIHYALHHRHYSNHPLAPGTRQQLHHGRLHSYPARNRHSRHLGASDSGLKK